jgi:hypothetical protein
MGVRDSRGLLGAGMTWYDITTDWDGRRYVENLLGAADKVLSDLGFRGYATQEDATAHPQTMNSFQYAVVRASTSGNEDV